MDKKAILNVVPLGKTLSRILLHLGGGQVAYLQRFRCFLVTGESKMLLVHNEI